MPLIDLAATTREALLRAGYDFRTLRKSTNFSSTVELVQRILAARGDTTDVMREEDDREHRLLIKMLGITLERMHLESPLWD